MTFEFNQIGRKGTRGPLDGIRIIDMTTVLFGPYCTLLLGDMGADVIKVESLEGDNTRSIGPSRHPGMAAMFLGLNRNKRSISVDLKQPQGRKIVMDLAKDADVFLSNVRPKALQRLGLCYADLRESNPGIVYCNAVGYGQKGPYADYPAFDDTIQAMSGTAALQAEFSGEPQYAATALADKSTGLMLALAIVSAVRNAEKTGAGQVVEVPLFETMVSFNLVEHLFGSVFVPALSEPKYPRVISPFRKPYKTQDGYLAVMPYNDGQWRRFFCVIGRADMASDERFGDMAARTRNIDALYQMLATAVEEKTSSEWLELLQSNDIPAVPVKGLGELLDDPQLAASGFFAPEHHPSEGELLCVPSPIAFSATPAALRRHAPRLGEHSVEILAQLGYGQSAIDSLKASGTIKDAA